MIAGLDTSVVVRLLVGVPEPLAAAALLYFEQRRGGGDEVMISPWVVAESYYALQHHYGVPKRDALRALRRLLESDGVQSTTEVSAVLALDGLESAKPGFVDRMIHAGYLQAGASEVVSFERALGKLPNTRVLTA